ncbi:MAG: helix-turn-helix domain-containing protein [Acidobacteriota bacterium]|nr:helix-turn-helix domain-containing protein [Acidobacteriota bacterium]
MPKKKYLVDLTTDEREQLHQLVRRGKHSSRKVTRARILLLAADDSTDEQIVASLRTGFATVERTRKRFVEESLGVSFRRRAARDGDEVRLLLACQLALCAAAWPLVEAARWTLRLLADKVVELKFADSICRETVRQVLKKTN